MVFHIRFALRRRTDAKFFSSKSILFIERPRVHVDLQGIKPEVIRRELTGMIEQSPANPAILIIWMDIEPIDKFFLHRQEGDRAIIHFNDPNSVFSQDLITKV